MRTVVVSLVLTAAASTVGVVVPAVSASAACDVFASRPYGGGSAVSGQGGRADCASRVQVKTDLKYDRTGLPDPTVAYRSGTVRNVTWVATDEDCSGTRTYYVDTNSETGQYSTSTRRQLSC